MKKELFTFALLASILIFSVINSVFISDLTAKTGELLLLAAEDETSAEKLVSEAEALWRRHDSYLSVVLRHSDIDGIEDAIYEIRRNIVSGNMAGVALAARMANERLKSVARFEQPRIGSIF